MLFIMYLLQLTRPITMGFIIFRLYEVLETPTKLHLVMEYMPGGELHSRLLSEGKMKENDAKIIFAQLLSAVMYLVGFCRIFT